MKIKPNSARVLSLFAALIMLLSVFTVLSPTVSFADSTVVAKDMDSGKAYTSIDEAWEAAKTGQGIVMTADWNIDGKGALTLKADESARVYMSGHKIYRTDRKDRVIYINKNGWLILRGCADNMYNYLRNTYDIPYYDGSGKTKNVQVSGVGGIIYGGYSNYEGGGIYMQEGAILQLDNVAVAGNYSGDDGGGIYIKDTVQSLKNYDSYALQIIDGGKVCYNYAKNDGGGIAVGGGIFQESYGLYVNLENGHIDNNIAGGDGGGFASDHDDTNIDMNSKSSVSNNSAGGAGGGIYFDGDQDSVNGGTIAENTAKDDGGGIYVSGEDNFGLDGTTLRGNSTGGNGGGIYMNGENAKIENCTFSGNVSAKNGGAIFLDQDCYVNNTTVTGNRVSSAGGEGGGVYVDSSSDINLSGKIIIKNNYRAENTSNVDDLFLQDGSLSTAYITGNPDTGSEVGLRTGESGDRKAGKGVSFTENVFFSDLPGFYMNASGSELWLRKHADASYAVYVNGKLQGYYNDTAVLTIDGTPADSNQVFVKWTEANGNTKFLDDTTKAVATVNQQAADGTKNNMALYFNAAYATKISDVTLEVTEPVAGEALETQGRLSWLAEDREMTVNVPIYWLTQNGKTTQTVSGVADYATEYSVAAKIDKNLENRIVFADTVTGKVQYGADKPENAYKIYVDKEGSLYVYGNTVTTKKAPIASVEEAYVSIVKGSTIEALKAELPTSATVYDVQGTQYTVELDNKKADFTYVEDSSEPTKVKDNGGTVSIPLKLDENAKIANGTGDDEKKLTVNVSVYTDGILDAPTASPKSGTCSERNAKGKVTQAITLSKEQANSKITYRCYELGAADKGSFSDYSDAISISADKGEKKVYVIEAKTENVGGGKDNSVVATYTYTLDNPYTLTVNKKVKASSAENDYSLGAYTAKYYKGDAVTIGAPVADGYVFSKWDAAAAEGLNGGVSYAETDNIINAGSINDDITLTALYTPVLTVDSLNITITAPKATESLAKAASKVSAVVSGKEADGNTRSKTIDMTSYIKGSLTWDPASQDGNAAYETVYTAKLTLPADNTSMKFDSLGKIVVNGDENLTANLKEENGAYAVYVTFPRTGASPQTEPVEQKTPTFTPPTAKTGLKYTGYDQELINAGSATGGNMLYKLSGDDDYSADIPTAKAAGEYTVFYRVLGDEGYKNTEEASLTVVIAEAEKKSGTSKKTEQTETEVTSDAETAYKDCTHGGDCVIDKFTDSDAKAWYHDGVHYCLEKGLMTGVSATKFAPNAVMTRAQLVTILWRLDGEKSVNYAMSYNDVASGSWYTEAVRWASAEGIVNGYSAEKFGTGDAVTREQLAAILWRYAQYKGMDVSVGEDTNIMDYDDVTEISSYAVSAMQWAVGEGIINGTGTYILSPNGTATRAQAAAMMQRFCS